MGCAGTQLLGNCPHNASANLTMGPLTLPTSVTTPEKAPSAGIKVDNCFIGTHRQITSDIRIRSLIVGAMSSIRPSLRPYLKASSETSKATMRVSGKARLRPAAIEPPIIPSPISPRHFITGSKPDPRHREKRDSPRASPLRPANAAASRTHQSA